MVATPSRVLDATARRPPYPAAVKTIDDIRRENLCALIRDRAENNQAAFSRMLEKDPNQVSQWLGKGNARYMSKATARAIEKKLNLPALWMDTDHALMNGEKVSVPLSRPARLDVRIVSEALKYLDFEEAEAKYPYGERGGRLVAILDWLETSGGHPPIEEIDAFIEAAKARRAQTGGVGDRDDVPGRAGRGR